MTTLSNHPEFLALFFILLSVISVTSAILTLGKIMYDVIDHKKTKIDYYSTIFVILLVLVVIFSNTSGYFIYRVINNIY